jgi:hypothetical protein
MNWERQQQEWLAAAAAAAAAAADDAAAAADDGDGVQAAEELPTAMSDAEVANALEKLHALAVPNVQGNAGFTASGAAARAGAAGSSSSAATDAAKQQQQQKQRYQPLTSDQAAAAEAALRVAAQSALLQQQQQQRLSHPIGDGSQPRDTAAAAAAGSSEDSDTALQPVAGCIVDAAAALQMVQLFYPGLLSEPALQPAAAQALVDLPDLAIECDHPPKYAWGWGDWFDPLPLQQLCTASGLRLACFGIGDKRVKQLLQQYTAWAAAGICSSGGNGSGGLLSWFLWARGLLLTELQEGVAQEAGDLRPPQEQLQQQVMARVQLAHVALSVYDAL